MIRYIFSRWGWNPASILHKSIAGRYRPVSYPDGPITARYRFMYNAYWECCLRWLSVLCIFHKQLIANVYIVYTYLFQNMFLQHRTYCDQLTTIKHFILDILNGMKYWNTQHFLFFQGWETAKLILISGLRTFILSMKFHFYTWLQDNLFLCQM